MTLTRILPTLRRTLPEPLHRADWPEHTLAAVDDLVVGGVSMVSLAGWCGTPCVHTGETSSVIVTRVQQIEERSGGSRAVWFDADVEAVGALVEHARLLGRVTSAPARRVIAAGRDVDLPADLRLGDLVAIPVRSLVTLHEIDPRRRSAPVPPPVEHAWSGRCGR